VVGGRLGCDEDTVSGHGGALDSDATPDVSKRRRILQTNCTEKRVEVAIFDVTTIPLDQRLPLSSPCKVPPRYTASCITNTCAPSPPTPPNTSPTPRAPGTAARGSGAETTCTLLTVRQG
jgi:hypothetical protein